MRTEERIRRALETLDRVSKRRGCDGTRMALQVGAVMNAFEWVLGIDTPGARALDDNLSQTELVAIGLASERNGGNNEPLIG